MCALAPIEEFVDYQKKYDWENTKRGVSDTLERAFYLFNGPVLNPKCDSHKKPRLGFFTDDDVDELKAAKEEEKKLEDIEESCWKHESEDRDKRWQKLEQTWADNEAELKRKRQKSGQEDFLKDEKSKGGVFKVTQDLNRGYGTVRSFVGAFKSEGDARQCHPGGGNACEYKMSKLQLNEEWTDSIGPMGWFGPAPLWFLGPTDTWAHGCYVKVERLSDYVPPEGKEPTYGIWTMQTNS
tara:strand:- start:59 stop:775 length:717 start_codon:yes stop_codon:yes gene_type:complete